MASATSHQPLATGPSPADERPAGQPRWPRRWHALTVSLAASFMTLLDVSIVNVALPSIERDLGASVGLATAAGPVIGGLLLTAFAGPDGWRWIFYVNLPIGLVALALAARLLPATARTAGAASSSTWSGRCCWAAASCACC